MRRIPSGAGPDGRGPDDRAIADYLGLCRAGEPSLEAFWAGLVPPGSIETLGALAKVDLQRRFDRGERPRAADYLGRFPELAGSGDRAVSLIYEEFCLLAENGEDPDSARFCDLYEPWRDSLRSQLACHRDLSRAVGPKAPPPRFPRPGDRFATYRLRSILGVGGSARVYLATDDELGDREVALKVSASVGAESVILAKLDHRNIVPILSVTPPENGLRGFCMPYRPGRTLEELVREVARDDDMPRDARAIREALGPVDGGATGRAAEDRPGWAGFPERGTYPEGVAWIGLALAEALAYLHGHDRGVLHRDIKPANVLLAHREGPQLLDFNLAHAPNAAEHARAALRGGTLPYMAPEQLRAFLDPEAWDRVGAPADLYALGLVLRVLLTGRAPEAPDPGRTLTRAIRDLHDRRSTPLAPVRQANPGVPPALESIVGKCLEFDPSRRYPGAPALAEDLRRFLAHRPLKFADNPSMFERAANFVHRNGLLLAVALALTVAFGLLARTPARVAELGEFRRAVDDLNSADPEGWRRARSAFAHLSQAHGTSAWPWLYLGASQEKLAVGRGGNRDLAEANSSWNKARNLPDFEAALSRRSREDPRSATVRMEEGRRFLKNLDDPLRFEKAYPALVVAVESDPGRSQALALLADAERGTDRLEDSAAHIARAIDLVDTKTPDSSKRINSWRVFELRVLVRLADRRLDRASTDRDRALAGAAFDGLGERWKVLDRDWPLGPPESPAMREYYRQFYRGSIASGRSALAAEDGRHDEAQRGFREARRAFEEAERAGTRDARGAESIRRLVAAKLEELEARSRKASRSGPGGPAARPAP